jgi:hypothetical protein
MKYIACNYCSKTIANTNTRKFDHLVKCTPYFDKMIEVNRDNAITLAAKRLSST